MSTKIRKNWLKALISYKLILPAVVGLISCLFLFEENTRSPLFYFLTLPDGTFTTGFNTITPHPLFLSTHLAFSLLSCWLYAYFAYYRAGMHLLLFFLILTPFFHFTSVNFLYVSLKNGVWLHGFLIALELAFFIWFYVASFRLYLFNRKIHKRKMKEIQQELN